MILMLVETTGTGPKGMKRRLKIRGKSANHPDHSTVKISWDTKMSQGELLSLRHQ